MTLRSDRWVRGDNEVALDSRVALKMGGASIDAAGGRPIIGLANSSSDLNPCNQPLADYVAPLRRSIELAGGVAVEFPVISLGEDLMKPSSMLYRNLLAMEVEESVRSQPLDGVIILAACEDVYKRQDRGPSTAGRLRPGFTRLERRLRAVVRRERSTSSGRVDLWCDARRTIK